MFQENFSDFTESAYAGMLGELKDRGYSFSRLTERPSGRHVILRHDVDYSMHRAARIAEIEASEGVVSTYFLLARSRFYGIAEPEISRLVSHIAACGHDIGLHFDGEIYGTTNWTATDLEGAITRERQLLEVLIDRRVESVTFHNPDLSNLIAFRDEMVGGLINGYSERLKADYVYASDSNGYWRHEPMPSVIRKDHDRLYLLTHPEWWTRDTMSPAERIERAITGRAKANQVHYDSLLARAGRQNIGRATTAQPMKNNLQEAQRELQSEKISKFKRRVPFGDLVTDRWQNAAEYGFGEGASCYDGALIIGDVKVGRQTWIGPNVVLDGSGGLEIGEYCSISAGVQIYTHHTVDWATSLGEAPVERRPTKIGSGVYIGPNVVIQMGVTIGDGAVIGAMSFVNRDIPAGAKAWGCPARIQPVTTK